MCCFVILKVAVCQFSGTVCCELLQVMESWAEPGTRLVFGVVNRCAHECQLKMQGLSTCSVHLAKRRQAFKVSHSLKVFSTKRTA